MTLGADHPLLGKEYKGSLVKGLKEKKDKPTSDGKVRYYLEIHCVNGKIYKEYEWQQYQQKHGRASDGLDQVLVVGSGATPPKTKSQSARKGGIPRIPRKQGSYHGSTDNTRASPQIHPKKKIVVKSFIKGNRKEKTNNGAAAKSKADESESSASFDTLPSTEDEKTAPTPALPVSPNRKIMSPETPPSRNVSVGDVQPFVGKAKLPLTPMDNVAEDDDDNDVGEDVKKQQQQQQEEEEEERRQKTEVAKLKIEEEACRLEVARKEKEAKKEKKRRKEEKKLRHQQQQEAEEGQRRTEQQQKEEDVERQRQQVSAAAAAADEEAKQRKIAEEEARRRAAEEWKEKLAAEEEERRRAAEEEAERLRAEQEAALRAADEERQRAEAEELAANARAAEKEVERLKTEQYAAFQAGEEKRLKAEAETVAVKKKAAKNAAEEVDEAEFESKAKTHTDEDTKTKMDVDEKDKKAKKSKKKSKSKDNIKDVMKRDKKEKKKSRSKDNVKDGLFEKKKEHTIPPPPLEQTSSPKKSKSKKKKKRDPPPLVQTSKGKLALNKISVDPQPLLETVEERPGVAKIMGIWGENYCEDAYPVSPLRATRGEGNEERRPKLRNIAEKWEMDPNFKPPVFEKSDAEKKRIFQSFEDNFAFSDLTPTEIEPMVDAFEKVEYSKGDVIAEEGAPDNFFYVVEEGKVSFDIDGEHVCDGEVGDVFGEMSLVYSCDRATTVKSEDKRTSLLRLDKTSYRHIRRNHVARSVSARVKLLKDVPFFKDAAEADLAQLSTAMVAHVFKTNDNLTNAFKDMPFCLIQEGSVTTTASGKMGPGGSFGEENLESGGHVASSVSARSDGVAYTIDRPSFEKVFGDMNQLAKKSQDKKILRDLRAIRAAKVDGPVLDLLARQVAEEPFLEGEEFCVMNEEMVPKLYIVREGSVKIVRKNGKEEIIKPGGFFGQEYMMMSSKGGRDSAPATVKAKYDATALEDGTCAVLTLQECVSVFGRDTRKPEELEDGRIIPLEDLDHYRVLGEGHFGTVWLVANKKEVKPEPFALKIQMLEDDERDAQECIKEEISVMRKLEYSSIVRVINVYEAEQTISMLLGLAPGGELFDQIHYQLPNGLWDSGIGEGKGRFYTSVIADTLAFMHVRGFIYRDLKPENVLIDKDGYPVITDFGFTRSLKKDELAYTMCGTPNYLPPEIIKNLGHGPPADNWSLAVLIYEVVQGESPFWYEGLDQCSLFHAICEEDYYPLPDEGVSEELRDLMHRMLEKNPSKRLGTFKEKDILSHPWFTKLDIQKIRKKEIKSPWMPKPVELGEPVDPEEIEESKS
ncbi:MAG: hypothetical protein SGILL_001979 [Bacillariaceae sp.]